jgi:hypothetical protein
MKVFLLDGNLESDAISRTKAARRSRNAVWGQKNKIENGARTFSLSARQRLAGEHDHVCGFVKRCPVRPNSYLESGSAARLKEKRKSTSKQPKAEKARGGGCGPAEWRGDRRRSQVCCDEEQGREKDKKKRTNQQLAPGGGDPVFIDSAGKANPKRAQ